MENFYKGRKEKGKLSLQKKEKLSSNRLLIGRMLKDSWPNFQRPERILFWI